MLLICKTRWLIMIWSMNKVKIYRVVPKKHPILLFIPKSCFTICFYSAGLGHSFDTDMNPTGWFTMQQWIKIIEACLATKSVLLTQRKFRRDFGRNSAPDRRTQFNVWWPNFGRQEVWQMPHKGHSGWHSNGSDPTSQGHFQSLDGYLHKVFLLLLYFDQFASARSEFCKERV